MEGSYSSIHPLEEERNRRITGTSRRMVGEGGVMVYESFIWYLFNELGEENRALQTGSYIFGRYFFSSIFYIELPNG